jgi:competence protein ComEC
LGYGEIGRLQVAKSVTAVAVHFIDVGQGDSILVVVEGVAVLIDGGTEAAGQIVLNYLSKLAVTRIHLMVATHMHSDHIGGLVSVLASVMQVDEILTNGEASNTSTYLSFMSLAQTHVVTVAYRGQVYVLSPKANLTVLSPTHPFQFLDQNDDSVVMKLQAEDTSFLFAGDAGAVTEQDMIVSGLNLKSNVLKVGHHGSQYATTDQFLNSVSCSHAVISAGNDNPYGHPNPLTVQRLLSHNVTVYGTYHSGTLVSETDGKSLMFVGSPQPIPELPAFSILLCLTVISLSFFVVYRRHT